MSNRFRITRRAALAATATAGLLIAAPVSALASTSHSQPSQHQHQPQGPKNKDLILHQVNLASDIPGLAPLTDPDLKNPWGISINATSQPWVADQGTDVSTLYKLNPDGKTVTKSTTTRTPMADSVLGPTGTVSYTGAGFLVGTGTTAPAQFIFATLDGHIEAWSAAVDPLNGNTEDKASVPGAAFSGLSIDPTADGGRLYATDAAAEGSKVDVFDSRFQQVKLPAGAFTDRFLPDGYHAFGTQVINGNVYVTYDTTDPATGREGTGPGIGVVDEYTPDGKLIRRVATGGTLDAPWGMAVAPSTWGHYARALLVGNFGNGEISIFPREGNHYASKAAGVVIDASTGKPFAEPGLWGLLPGTPSEGGTSSLWFAAGLNGEQDGLLGLLRP